MTEGIYRKKHLTSSQVIILGFAGVILLGAFLLMLPVASAEGVAKSFHEALQDSLYRIRAVIGHFSDRQSFLR